MVFTVSGKRASPVDCVAKTALWPSQKAATAIAVTISSIKMIRTMHQAPIGK
jgi:hypothetical protein